MKKLISIILVFLCSWGIAQVQYVTFLDNFDDNALYPTYDGESVYNEVWGFVHKGNEYAVMGGTLGTYIFEITDDDELHLIQAVLGAHGGLDVIHRDYHDYKGYLYEVADEGATSTLRIYDLQYLPDSVHIVSDSQEHIIRSHNIFIDTTSALLYSCGNTNQLGGDALKVLSLADPENPTLVYDYNFVDYVHDIFVRNDTAYLNAAFQGLRVVDFSTPTMPVMIGSLEFYTDKGYNHSGWLSEDGKTYVMCDETVGMRFKVLDVSDLSDIKVKSAAMPDSFEETFPHNVMLKDGLAYFSYYNDGLQIYDVRNPSNPKQIAYYDTYQPEDTGSNLYRGAWGIYAFLPSGRLLVSDRKDGLFLLGYTPPPIMQVEEGEHGVYPNPAIGSAFFYSEQKFNEPYTLEIINALGQQVRIFEGINDHLYLDLEGLPSGMYWYHYESDVIVDSELFGKFMILK